MSTVFLVEDDPSIAERVSDLRDEMNLASRVFTTGEQFLAILGPETSGCLVLDLVLPGMSGLDLLDVLRRRGSDLPVVAVSGHASVPIAVRAMKAGAVTVVEKPFSITDLKTAIGAALDLERTRLPQRRLRQVAAERFATLSDVERDILELLLSGLPNKVVAARLRVSQRSVERHRATAFRKLGVETLVGAGTICARLQRWPLPAATLQPRRVA